MVVFNRKPKLLIIEIIDDKIKKARKKNINYFFYPFTDAEIDSVKQYVEKQYHAIVEPDHKIEFTTVYKVYGF